MTFPEKSNKIILTMLKKNKVQLLLMKKGITQKEIADSLGVKPSAVAHCVRGFSKSKKIRQAISDAIGRPIGNLF